MVDKRTLTALRGSIKKWEGIVAGTAADEGTSNCPLCAEFYDETDDKFQYGCAGCPVSEATGMDECAGTPYGAWAEEHEDEGIPFSRKIRDDDTAIAAVLELEFLRSLLPSRRK